MARQIASLIMAFACSFGFYCFMGAPVLGQDARVDAKTAKNPIWLSVHSLGKDPAPNVGDGFVLTPNLEIIGQRKTNCFDLGDDRAKYTQRQALNINERKSHFHKSKVDVSMSFGLNSEERAKAVFAKESSKFSIHNDFSYSETGMQIYLEATRIPFKYQLVDGSPNLTGDAVKLLQNDDPSPFEMKCGTGYIAEVQHGGRARLKIEMTSHSLSDKLQFSGAFSEDAGIGEVSESAKTKFNAKITAGMSVEDTKTAYKSEGLPEDQKAADDRNAKCKEQPSGCFAKPLIEKEWNSFWATAMKDIGKDEDYAVHSYLYIPYDGNISNYKPKKKSDPFAGIHDEVTFAMTALKIIDDEFRRARKSKENYVWRNCDGDCIEKSHNGVQNHLANVISQAKSCLVARGNKKCTLSKADYLRGVIYLWLHDLPLRKSFQPENVESWVSTDIYRHLVKRVWMQPLRNSAVNAFEPASAERRRWEWEEKDIDHLLWDYATKKSDPFNGTKIWCETARHPKEVYGLVNVKAIHVIDAATDGRTTFTFESEPKCLYGTDKHEQWIDFTDASSVCLQPHLYSSFENVSRTYCDDSNVDGSNIGTANKFPRINVRDNE